MLLEIAIAILIGVFFGTFTGLIPGIHINLISIFLISLSATIFSSINPTYLIVFITSLAITHTFLDFIPAIFLGCPDTDTELSILPGHELLKQGKGYEAIILTTYGSLAAIIMILIIFYPLIILKSFIFAKYYLLKPLIPGLLILASLFLISLENKKAKAIFVFLLTGFLGFCVLNLENLKEPLLPLLTGLFGSSMLILSIKNKVNIPEQEIIKPKINSIKPFLCALLASPLCSFLPGLGAGQAAIIGNSIAKTDRRGFLMLLGATNTLVMGFSFITFYIVSKTRTGAAVAIKQLTKYATKDLIILIIITTSITGIIAFFLTIKLAKIFSKQITKINYTKLSITTIILLTIITLLISGIFGLMVLIASTLTGIYCIQLNVRRTNMMGCLIIPTLFWYLF